MKKEKRVWGGTYTWQMTREGGLNGEELDGLSEVRIVLSIMTRKLD
jgi:hypothetical protein